MRAHACTLFHTHPYTHTTHNIHALPPFPFAPVPPPPLSRTHTCEQLERVVCDEIDAEAETDQFKQRVEEDSFGYDRDDRVRFITSIKEEAATRVRVYEEKPPVYFTDSAGLGKAINDALALPLLAR